MSTKQLEAIKVPEIAGGETVEVIEVLVNPGDTVAVDDALITLESDKATMDITASDSGIVKNILVKVGDKLSSGDDVLSLEMQSTANGHVAEAPPKVANETLVAQASIPTKTTPQQTTAPAVSNDQDLAQTNNQSSINASPIVRRLAYEFGLSLNDVPASGVKGRITKTDIQHYVKSRMRETSSGSLNLPSTPAIDFSQFGKIDTQPLKKIKKITGKRLHQSWVSVPHVTQFDEADITELEAFRQREKQTALKQGIRLTPLVFLMKAVVAALKQFPQFNSSLAPDGESLIFKKYFHIGVAVDTPNGLVVPVIRDVDQKGLLALAKELGEVSQQAREKGLSIEQMQGGCFSISSLGGIGGSAFTPIVNTPEVAILGVAKSAMKPIYQDGEFQARLMLPLALSYDHRVIDGAEAARFIVCLSEALSDLPKILL